MTGNAYASELQTRFFEPLGLGHTHVYGPSSAKPTMPSYVLWCAGQSEPGAMPDGSPEAPVKKSAEPSGKAPAAAGGPPACPSRRGAWRPMAAPYDHIWPLIWAAGGVQSSTSDMTKLDNSSRCHRRRAGCRTSQAHADDAPQSKVGIDKQFPSDMAASMSGYGLGLIIFDYDNRHRLRTLRQHPGLRVEFRLLPRTGQRFRDDNRRKRVGGRSGGRQQQCDRRRDQSDALRTAISGKVRSRLGPGRAAVLSDPVNPSAVIR